MPTYTTRGPARVTITELGPVGPIGGLVIIALAVALIHRYAHTITEAAELAVTVAFATVVLAFVTMAVLLTRRILTELRPVKRSAPAVPAARAAGQLQHQAAPAIPPPPPADIDVKPEWIIPREAAR
jgi:hypothetical protein